MNKNSIFNTIKWIVIGVIALLLLKECNSTFKSYLPTFKPEADTVTIVKHKSDTIWAKDTIYKFKPKYIFKPTTDTFWKPIYIDSTECNRIGRYLDTLKDGNIELYTDIHVQGRLRALKPSYKLKIPIKIVDTVTVTTTITNTITVPSNLQLHIGATVSTGLLAPEVGVSFKRHTFRAGYNLQNKFPTIGYSYTIFRK